MFLYLLLYKEIMHKPNILSNKLDQVPKNTRTRYQARMDAIADQIEHAFNGMIELKWDPGVEAWLENNQDKIDFNKLAELKDYQHMNFVIQKESSPQEEQVSSGRKEAFSMPMDPAMLPFSRGKPLSRDDAPLLPGEVLTYLSVQKLPAQDGFKHNRDYQINMYQIKVPEATALLPKGLVFHKELKGDELNSITID